MLMMLMTMGASVMSWYTASEGEAEKAEEEVTWTFAQLAEHMEELDRAQLRLSSFAEDQLVKWLELEPDSGGVSDQDPGIAEVQEAWERVDELRDELKALTAVEVHEPVPNVQEAAEGNLVLQTRTVSLPEVLANWEVWREPAKKELEALISEKRALVPVDWKQIEQWRKAGKRVITLPAKCVWSIKAPDGRFKCRIVACGNMAPAKQESKQVYEEAVFTASLDITHLRAALAWSTRRSHDVAATDIRTAFLNAEILPRDRVKAEQVAQAVIDREEVPQEPLDEIVILIPPKCLTQRGLVPRWVSWRVAKAVYGLDTSPRDWSLSRDNVLRGLSVVFRDKPVYLFQSFAEPNLWLMAEKEPEPGWCSAGLGLDKLESSGAQALGWIGVYIDDLVLVGVRELVEAWLGTVTRVWKCGVPEWITQDRLKPLRFLGLELAWYLYL